MLIDIDKIIGRRNGIIKEVFKAEAPEGEPDIFSFVAERGKLDWETDQGDATEYGGGGDLTKVGALLSACGEVVERYCSSFISKQDIIQGSYNSLKNRARLLDPETVALFSENQYRQKDFPFKKFTKDSSIEWTRAYSHKQQSEIYVPAFLVYLPYSDYEKGGCHAPSSSSGLACAPSLKEAIDKGALEMIERDAFVISWLNKLTPPRIDFSNFTCEPKLKRLFALPHIDYKIFDITSDFKVPTISAFCFGNSSFGYVASMGLASSLDYAYSLKKAVIENMMGRRAVFFYRKLNPTKKYKKDFSDVLNFHDHGYLYSTDKSLRQNIKFLFSPNHANKDYSPKNPVIKNDLISHILSCGFDVITKDLTTPDIADTGLRVARTIIPGLASLHGIHQFPFLGCKRIYEPGKIFPWSDKKTTSEEEIKNFPPHMLP